VAWIPQLLRTRTATAAAEPEAGTPATEPKKDEAKPAEEKAEETIRGLLPPVNASKPLLVFFHWPHEDGERGRRILKFCGGPLDDEAFVRVTPLFHCIEVNTRDSEEKLVAEAKVRVTPTLAVCRLDGTVVWRSEEAGGSGRALAETLKRVLREKFPEDWKRVEKDQDGQKEILASSRRLAAAGKHREAMEALYPLVDSDVRFTETWSEAVKTLRDLEKKVAEAEEKK
jgi:hypothetical protein